MSFMILFFVALLMFGIPISMLNLGRTDAEDSTLVSPFFNFWLADALMNQYILSLGEFGSLTENAEGDNFETELILIFFSLATFFVQITMLNMLIAIMGDSFDRSMENRERFGIMTKLEILASNAPVMIQKSAAEDAEILFMIVVEPLDNEDNDDDDWTGSINKVTKIMKNAIEAQETTFAKKVKSEI